MIFLDFVQWWYTAGWISRFQAVPGSIASWINYFSVGTLLKTMFKPWRQIITSTRPDQRMQAKMSALVDNLVSRVVGFFIRFFVLITALLFAVGVFIFDLLVAILWPVLPITPVIVLMFGFGVVSL